MARLNRSPSFNIFRRLETIKKTRLQREEISQVRGVSLPFVDVVRRYELDEFERDVVMLLFVSATSSTFKALLENSIFNYNSFKTRIEARAIISILERDFAKQIRHRRYFSANARLIRNEILLGLSERYDPSESVMDQDFCVHQRIVNHILGDDNVYSMDMGCIERVRSNVSIDKLVLPGDQKHEIMEKISNHVKGTQRRSDLKISAHFGYGTGMACLFHGPSGTGKTMMAHCIANHLQMDLLMVSMDGPESMSVDDIIKYTFKEAQLTGHAGSR